MQIYYYHWVLTIVKARYSLEEIKMRKKPLKKIHAIGIVVLTEMIASISIAEEKIVQQEAISFEKCLKVITTSQDKLSIAPEIKDISSQKRVAVFTLIDGTLTIVCDAVEGKVTVLTNTD